MTGSTHPELLQIPKSRAPSQVTSELVGLAEILGAVGREIVRLGQVACDLQETLSPLAHEFKQDGRTIEDLQVLDLLSQHLFGVSDFLNALAPTLPTEWVGDSIAAARTMTLSNLAQRLGRPHRDFHLIEGEGGGALELFEVGGE